jgi:hypothetical protein
VNTTMRPCVLVSWTGSICQIALFATYGNSPQEQINSAALRHFSIPISYLSPRHGLVTVDLNRAQAASREPPLHQYVVACTGGVRVDELCEWTDCAGQYIGTLDEGAMRRLEACASERLQTWEQIQSQASGRNPQFQIYPLQSGLNHSPVAYVSTWRTPVRRMTHFSDHSLLSKMLRQVIQRRPLGEILSFDAETGLIIRQIAVGMSRIALEACGDPKKGWPQPSLTDYLVLCFYKFIS